MPPTKGLHSLAIGGLRVSEATVDLALERSADDVVVVLGHREGEVDLVVTK